MVKRTDYAGDCLHVPPDPFPAAFCCLCSEMLASVNVSVGLLNTAKKRHRG